ncbi:hypothetical protein LEP1GSC019_0342 [Leptospira interrogans serovar Pyrogenes str. 2006006960]|nr:hypothetical protein LEP1GSC019_0342 [Leptospira interrogans serovar Pyrogenes str. 2006006960]
MKSILFKTCLKPQKSILEVVEIKKEIQKMNYRKDSIVSHKNLLQVLKYYRLTSR